MKRRRLAELVREEAGALREAPPEVGALEEASTPREEKPGEAPAAQASPEGQGERPPPPTSPTCARSAASAPTSWTPSPP